MKPINTEKLLKLIEDKPGITSKKILVELHIVGKHEKSGYNLLYAAKKAYESMSGSPVFFQQCGNSVLWFTAQYAKIHNLSNNKKPNRDNTEEMTLANHRATIDSHWRIPCLT